MKTTEPRRAPGAAIQKRLACMLAACLMGACGGGGGVGSGGTGVSSGGSLASGLAVGTVGGFGSIFVGGVRCDDTHAQVGYVTSTGAPETGTPDVKLGQSVEIAFDPASSSCTVLQALVDAEVVGVVGSTAPLTVAGQRVVLNADATQAPTTVVDGYADASAIQVGDRVEVHGKAISSGGVAAIQASRIERKAATDTWVRARGVVAGLSASQFVIGGLTVKRDASTRLDPAGLVLANGQTLTVWSNAAVANDGSITASVVRLSRHSLSDQQAVRVEGPVSGCSAMPCTLPTVDGLLVDLSSASFAAGSLADVANGVALRVDGLWDATRARLVATQASVRARDSTAGDVTLIGMVSDFVSSTDFSVRGVAVTTDAGTTVGAGCTVAAGQIVGIKGQIAQSQVVARTVDCLTLANGNTLDIFGALLNVSATARTFNLSEGPYRSYTLSWDDNTVFAAGLSAAQLTGGLRVGLRAVLTNGTLLVKRIVADPVPTTAPAGATLYGNFGIARDVTAGSLTVGQIQMAIVPGTTQLGGSVVDGTAVRTWFYRSGPLQPWIALQVKPVAWN